MRVADDQVSVGIQRQAGRPVELTRAGAVATHSTDVPPVGFEGLDVVAMLIGVPIVLSAPDHVVAQAINSVAEQVAAQVSIRAFRTIPLTPVS